MKTSILTYKEYMLQQEQEDIRFEQFLNCKNKEELRKYHRIIYEQHNKRVKLNWEREYKEQKGWGIVKPIIDLKKIAPLCKYVFRSNSLKGCNFCKSKRYWYEVIDPNQPVWALYFSMNLVPLWTKLQKRWPYWTQAQVQNNRYWRATKHKLLKEFEIEFLKSHPGPWCRALNRAVGYYDKKTGEWIHCPHTTYTFGIWYNKTMEQIKIYMRWPPEPHPLTIQFLGRPKPGVDLSKDSFILSKETINKRAKRAKKLNQIKKSEQEILQEHIDFTEIAANLKSEDFNHLLY